MRSLMLLDNEDAKDKVVPALRTRSNVSGVAFIEFAVDQPHVAGLAQLFRGLGFRLTGRHRSKAVERWSEGSINFATFLAHLARLRRSPMRMPSAPSCWRLWSRPCWCRSCGM